jgi:hypothetical protein
VPPPIGDGDGIRPDRSLVAILIAIPAGVAPNLAAWAVFARPPKPDVVLRVPGSITVQRGQVVAIEVPNQTEGCLWLSNDLTGAALQPVAAGFQPETGAFRILFRAREPGLERVRVRYSGRSRTGDCTSTDRAARDVAPRIS